MISSFAAAGTTCGILYCSASFATAFAFAEVYGPTIAATSVRAPTNSGPGGSGAPRFLVEKLSFEVPDSWAPRGDAKRLAAAHPEGLGRLDVQRADRSYTDESECLAQAEVMLEKGAAQATNVRRHPTTFAGRPGQAAEGDQGAWHGWAWAFCDGATQYRVSFFGAIPLQADVLAAWNGGDADALDRLMELVYPELRRIARQHLERRAVRRGFPEREAIDHHVGEERVGEPDEGEHEDRAFDDQDQRTCELQPWPCRSQRAEQALAAHDEPAEQEDQRTADPHDLADGIVGH